MATADRNKANPIQIEKYLKGASYPANKQDLVEYASKNDAPEDIINTLNNLSDEDYNSPADVSKGIGNLQ